MTSNRLERAIARQSRIRRARDVGWMLFATAAVAGLFGWSATIAYLRTAPTAWLAALLMGTFSLAMTAATYRLWIASRALNVRLKAAESLATLDDRPERDVSVWSEVFPRRRGD